MDEYKNWIKQAEDDLLWAKDSFDDGHYSGVCFLSQQIVEKALKGYLLFRGRPLRKIHAVLALLENSTETDPTFESVRENVLFVSPMYIKTRYPSYEDIDQFTKEQAEEAYDHAKSVLKFVKEKLSS